MTPTMEHNRLRWAARRGMLELDLLFAAFLDRQYDALTEDQQRTFARLLGCEDQELYAWLMGRADAPDAELQAMVARVRGDALPAP